MIEGPITPDEQAKIDAMNFEVRARRWVYRGSVQQRVFSWKDETRPFLNDNPFLRRVRQELLPSPCRIYYPGSSTDTFLSKVFDRDEIFRMDERMIKSRVKGTFFQGMFGQDSKGELFHPIQNEVLDAMVYRDCHASVETFGGMVKSLKFGGLVLLYIDPVCEDNLTTEQMASIPGLEQMQLPYTHRWIDVFRKAPLIP